jgi:hypothetical protein
MNILTIKAIHPSGLREIVVDGVHKVMLQTNTLILDKERCKLVCDYTFSDLCSGEREDCYGCNGYEEIPALLPSKPRIVAV